MKKLLKNIFGLVLLTLVGLTFMGCCKRQSDANRTFPSIAISEIMKALEKEQKITPVECNFKLKKDGSFQRENLNKIIYSDTSYIITNQGIYSFVDNKLLSKGDKLNGDTIKEIEVVEDYQRRIKITTDSNKIIETDFSDVSNLFNEPKKENKNVGPFTKINFDETRGDYSYFLERSNGFVYKISIFKNEKPFKEIYPEQTGENSDLWILSNGNILFQYKIPVNNFSDDYHITEDMGPMSRNYKIYHQLYNIKKDKFSYKDLGIYIHGHKINLNDPSVPFLDFIEFSLVNKFSKEISLSQKIGNINPEKLSIKEIALPFGNISEVDHINKLTDETIIVNVGSLIYIMNVKTNEILNSFSIPNHNVKIHKNKLILTSNNSKETSIYEIIDNNPKKITTPNGLRYINTGGNSLAKFIDSNDNKYYLTDKGLEGYKGEIINAAPYELLKTDTSLSLLTKEGEIIATQNGDFSDISVSECLNLYIRPIYINANRSHLVFIVDGDNEISFKVFKL